MVRRKRSTRPTLDTPKTAAVTEDRGSGPAAEPVTVDQAADSAPAGSCPSTIRPPFVWARVDGTPEQPIGIKLEEEKERRPGVSQARMMIRFREDALPTPAEKARLYAEGFRFDAAERAWGVPKTHATRELAVRVVNDLIKGRGYDGQLYLGR